MAHAPLLGISDVFLLLHWEVEPSTFNLVTSLECEALKVVVQLYLLSSIECSCFLVETLCRALKAA